METRILGKSGIKVSQLGLGCGGNSRLGMSYGRSEEEAAEVVRAALEMGVTLIDTARGYGTERAVGLGLKGWPRDQVILSSKTPYLDEAGELLPAKKLEENIETSLRDLQVEKIDIYFLHGMSAAFYPRARARFLPVLEKARRDGKIGIFGLTEMFERDTRHEMLQLALADDGWDIYMVGFNLLNQTALARVFTPASARGIATLGMFAVRRGLIAPDLLRVVLERLADSGEIDHGLVKSPNLLAEMGLEDEGISLVEAAYRFCAYTPGLNAVLCGTGSSEHLQSNLRAIEKGPLPEHVTSRLRELFARVESVSGQVR